MSVFQYAFVQRGLLEVGLLSVGLGLLGTWIVLRGLAFYAHAAGTAAFPGLVLADGLAFSAPVGAFAAAFGFAAAVHLLDRRRRESYDALTALALVGSLALGVVLASDVFQSGSNVETLLFGSILLVGTRELVLAAGLSAVALAATVTLGPRWLAAGFDPLSARAFGARPAALDAVLLLLVAMGVVACLSALGALLVSSLLVVPAATARLFTRRLRSWQVASVALVTLEGAAGLWLSVEANVPAGAGIAVLTGGAFALVGLARAAGRRKLLRAAAVLGAVLATALLAGCGPTASSGAGVHVVATTTQIGDWTRIVGGDSVSVHQILQPNTDPHEYEPRPADVVATAGAEVVFENGDGLDHWMAKVVSEAGGHPEVVDLGARVPVRLPGETSGPEASRYDPHWWHDPRNAEAAVRVIASTLGSADPAHRSLFERNAARYVARLRALDRAIEACLGSLPVSARTLVTDHDAFGYFARRYGLRIVGSVIPSQTTQAQPSAGATAKLVAAIRAAHVHAIFPETSLNPRLVQAVARETGATAGASLYGDTLGPARSAGATYVSMEAANAKAIARGLSGGAVRCRLPG